MTTQSGILTSPSYPQNYPNNADCIYTITQPTAIVFKLNFLNMAIDECTQSSCSSQCPWDYIEIRDGQSESSPLLINLCGNDIYVGIHNQLFLRLVVIFGININYVTKTNLAIKIILDSSLMIALVDKDFKSNTIPWIYSLNVVEAILTPVEF